MNKQLTYKCPRCGYETNKKDSMSRHFNRKKMCKSSVKNIILDLGTKNLILKGIDVRNGHICEFCSKSFSRKFTLGRHLDICKSKPTEKSQKNDEILVKMNELVKIIELEEQLKQKDKQIKDLTRKKDKQIKDLTRKLENNRLLCNTTKDRIRQNSRSLYKKSGLSMSCLNCKYNKHVHICHIREINDFKTSDKVAKINDLSNLVALCSNCHHELDKLKNPKVIRKVKIHSILISSIIGFE